MTTIDRNRSALPQVGRQTTEKAQQPATTAATPVKNAVAQGAKPVADGFDSGPARKVSASLLGGSKPSDKVFDGQFVGAGGQTFPPGTPLSQIPGVTPRNNPNPTKTVIYLNGIMTDKAGQSSDLQAIADKTGAKAVGIHNSTEGFFTDLAQCVKDKLDKGTNPAVDTLADTLYSELKAGRDVQLMGYSQGGLITARALFDVERRLRIEDGMSKGDTEKLMSKLSVETFGAASTKYPDGPKYVHYVNNRDIVPTFTGLGGSVDPLAFLKDAGKGAVVHRFGDGGLNVVGNHSLQDMYLKHRVPFDEARAGRFND
ncbi:hypothetical protein [Vitiosangium sp. GDMCC 1.1324]|uniref:hypothetical protein n=1 Tax=Vitiosangium sp. (strain GDMCC 1.1324) TaxID=2138576 RepID=UPI000D3C6E64|nr:hypothetical protein [Vitiosangium sp. GDMCC 1.1324]PTL84549.1 hypothetical protein DAT35_05580 [Vitiosangium sp. GDMCC 1.1324]